MKIEGNAVKLGDNINTDFIISGRYKFSITDISELAKHLMEDIDPNFTSRITPGKSILVAGKNFGMGSSREQAPLVIREAGITAVLAKEFARIFFRNSFNIGLQVIETDTDQIDDTDRLHLDLDRGVIRNITRGIQLRAHPVPAFMQELLHAGGVVQYLKKYGKLPDV
ncbi:MAG: 3-isopropylmalate dehydratase [Candidatus Omnitrophica bacterium]|nr:3-isopropylmalate dehydratase [Candidatus Omnitrophota bacterium]